MKQAIRVALMALPFQLFAQSGITWESTKNIAPSSSGNDHPRVVVNAAGNPLVVWNHASRCMFSRWDGAAFTTPVLLNTPNINVAGADWMGPDIAAKGDTVYVVMKQIRLPKPFKRTGQYFSAICDR